MSCAYDQLVSWVWGAWHEPGFKRASAGVSMLLLRQLLPLGMVFGATNKNIMRVHVLVAQSAFELHIGLNRQKIPFLVARISKLLAPGWAVQLRDNDARVRCLLRIMCDGCTTVPGGFAYALYNSHALYVLITRYV